MRNTICAGFAVAALLVCGALVEAAQPSAAKMSQLGLSGATVVSDDAAMGVRGLGWNGGGQTRNRVTIWGESKAKVTVQSGGVAVELKSEHGYHSTTSGSQVGGDLSFVGAAVVVGSTGDSNGPALSSSNGGGVSGGALILFSGGASGVRVGGRH